MIKSKLKKGQRVLVWSLQSWSNGGFFKGEPAFLRQSQTGDSVILCLVQNINGKYVVTDSYEVYREQVKRVYSENWPAKKALKKYRKEIMANIYIR